MLLGCAVLLLSACGQQANLGSGSADAGTSHSSQPSPDSYTGKTWNDGSVFSRLPRVTDGTLESYTISEDGNTLDVRVTCLTRAQAQKYFQALQQCGAEGDPIHIGETMTSYSSGFDAFLFAGVWTAADNSANSGAVSELSLHILYSGGANGE